MATIINNPQGERGSGSTVGIVVGVIIALAIIALFLVYGLPALRNRGQQDSSGTNADIHVGLPGSDPNPPAQPPPPRY